MDRVGVCRGSEPCGLYADRIQDFTEKEQIIKCLFPFRGSRGFPFYFI